MDGFVLDASVAISWCFPFDSTENTPYSRAILKHIEEVNVVVPEIWAFEIANTRRMAQGHSFGISGEEA